jgi:hypothetical protein
MPNRLAAPPCPWILPFVFDNTRRICLLEVIEVRTGDRNQDLLKAQLQKLIRETDPGTKEQTIVVYNRAMINSDFSIHLFHSTEKVDINGSPLGLQLVSGLKGSGLVNHTIWLELKG